MADAEQTYEDMSSVVLMEQFFNSCSGNMGMFLRERKPATIDDVAELADQYIEARGGWGISASVQDSSVKSLNQAKVVSSKMTIQRNHNQEKLEPVERKGRFSGKCFLCERFGHMAKDCKTPKVRERVAGLQVQQLRSTGVRKSDAQEVDKSSEGNKSLPMMSVVCGSQKVTMPVTQGTVNGVEVSVLRDTGCSTAVIRQDLVQESQYTGEMKTCILIDGTERKVPEARVIVDTPYYQGMLDVVCMTKPVYDLILGNLPEVKVISDSDTLWRKSDLEASAVETRSQRIHSRKLKPALKVPDPLPDIATPEQLAEAQKEDDSLEALRSQADSGLVKISKHGNTSKFLYKDDILCREFTAKKGSHETIPSSGTS